MGVTTGTVAVGALTMPLELAGAVVCVSQAASNRPIMESNIRKRWGLLIFINISNYLQEQLVYTFQSLKGQVEGSAPHFLVSGY